PGEVVVHGRTVQEGPERYESPRGSQGAVAGHTPALFDGLGRRIENFHERYGTGGDPHRRLHEVSLGTEARKGKPGSATALVDQGLLLQGIENADETIVHRED